MSKVEVRTTELGMAAYLYLHGLAPLRMEMLNHREAAWVFEGGESTTALMADFADGCAEVEPRDYQKSLTRARKTLFQFLDGQKS